MGEMTRVAVHTNGEVNQGRVLTEHMNEAAQESSSQCPTPGPTSNALSGGLLNYNMKVYNYIQFRLEAPSPPISQKTFTRMPVPVSSTTQHTSLP